MDTMPSLEDHSVIFEEGSEAPRKGIRRCGSGRVNRPMRRPASKLPQRGQCDLAGAEASGRVVAAGGARK